MRWSRHSDSRTPIGPDGDFLELLHEVALAAYERQLAFTQVVGDRDWLLDQQGAILVLGNDLVLPAQVIGTESSVAG